MPRRFRGWKALVHDAVDAVTHLVEEGHASAARAVLRVTDRLGPVAAPARAIDRVRDGVTDGALRAVRGVNRAVEWSVDAGLDRIPAGPEPEPIPLRSDVLGTLPWLEDAALGLVASAIGDRLGDGPLDLGMRLRHRDQYVPWPPAPRADRPEIVVLVHGLGTTEWCWSLAAARALGDPAANYGTLLERDLRLEPLYVRYNSGRSVAVSGRALADRLQVLAQAWDPARIVLLGHSLGGRVAQAAVRAGVEDGHGWVERLTDVVCLATPNRPQPLAHWADRAERELAAIDLPTTRILARILGGRSAATRDLRRRARTIPALPHVRRTFLAGVATADPDHPVGRWFGDGLVTVDSARGAEPHDRTFHGMHHYRILCDPTVYEAIRGVLARSTGDRVPYGSGEAGGGQHPADS